MAQRLSEQSFVSRLFLVLLPVLRIHVGLLSVLRKKPCRLFLGEQRSMARNELTRSAKRRRLSVRAYATLKAEEVIVTSDESTETRQS